MMESQGQAPAGIGAMSRGETLRLAGTLLSVALLIGLGAILLSRIATANQAVKQATRITTPSMVGATAPDVTLTVWSGGTAGQSFALASLHGHPVVMNVWESTCVPCQAEAPLLESAYTTYNAKGVAFVGVALETSQADGLAFLQQHHLTYLAGLAPTNQTTVDYRIIGVPDTYFISAQDKVVYAVVGQLTKQTLNAGLAKLTT
jgi:cytochrome c biogenesis protein CcmG, thiol:disulfide interchange protein DsbE